MDDRMALHRNQWDLSNMTKDLFGISFDMLFSELYKIMVHKVDFRGGDREVCWRNKLRQNVGLQAWIWRHIVTSQTAYIM